MKADAKRLEKLYFEWLCLDAFANPQDRINYEGVMRLIHDIPFYWTMWSDENRVGDALSFRQSDFLSMQNKAWIDAMDQHWLGDWANAAPSVFEVLMGMARRWSFYFELPVSTFFQHMFINMGWHYYVGKNLPERTCDLIRTSADNWMARQFSANGEGSPFPVRYALGVVDMRKLDIWSQMNAYSAEHFQ